MILGAYGLLINCFSAYKQQGWFLLLKTLTAQPQTGAWGRGGGLMSCSSEGHASAPGPGSALGTPPAEPEQDSEAMGSEAVLARGARPAAEA